MVFCSIVRTWAVFVFTIIHTRAIAFTLINSINDKNNRIEILTKKTIRNRLLEYFKIVSLKNKSKNIYLPFTFTDLADYLAIDRSAMTRELKNLKEEGFIEIKNKRITLLY